MEKRTALFPLPIRHTIAPVLPHIQKHCAARKWPTGVISIGSFNFDANQLLKQCLAEASLLWGRLAGKALARIPNAEERAQSVAKKLSDDTDVRRERDVDGTNVDHLHFMAKRSTLLWPFRSLYHPGNSKKKDAGSKDSKDVGTKSIMRWSNGRGIEFRIGNSYVNDLGGSDERKEVSYSGIMRKLYDSIKDWEASPLRAVIENKLPMEQAVAKDVRRIITGRLPFWTHTCSATCTCPLYLLTGSMISPLCPPVILMLCMSMPYRCNDNGRVHTKLFGSYDGINST
jgi:hypothetical protein